MRIVITGATGNVGTALLNQLVRSGEHELVSVVRRPPPPEGVYSQVAWHAVDLATASAPPELARIFDGADTVVHLAWGFQPTRNTDYLRQVAVGGSVRTWTLRTTRRRVLAHDRCAGIAVQSLQVDRRSSSGRLRTPPG